MPAAAAYIAIFNYISYSRTLRSAISIRRRDKLNAARHASQMLIAIAIAIHSASLSLSSIILRHDSVCFLPYNDSWR